MIITDKFVLLNMPKIGSSFARKCIKAIYRNQISSLSLPEKILHLLRVKKTPYLKELMVKRVGMSAPDQHGGYSDMPLKHRTKKIVSIIRNPYDLLLSHYTYGWWKKNAVLSRPILEKYFPNFPNLSLKEYIDYRCFQLDPARKGDAKLGFLTRDFMRMFFKDYRRTIAAMHDIDQVNREFINEHMAPIKFLRTRTLKEDLFSCLSELNYREEDIKFILNAEKVNQTQRKARNRRDDLLNADLLSYFNKKEAYLMRFIEVLGIDL